jgi:hypothetical protein
MRHIVRFVGLSCAVCLLHAAPSGVDAPQLIRSLSGPAGRVAGPKFIFDEIRNRFVYPQDKNLTVYFEWEAPPGLHVLTGSWRQPDGRIASISSDVKVETKSNLLNCYWIFTITPDLPNGIWTLEVRIDGRPAGSHPFEIAGIEVPKQNAAAPEPPKQPSVDEIYKATSPSVVWIYKLDEEGRRVDTSSGFIFAPGRIATAFQSIDSASRLEVEFANGRKVIIDSVLAFSRVADWALLAVDTGSLPAIAHGKPQDVAVGERLIVFNVEANARVIGGVDIAGRRTIKEFGERIQISPPLVLEAAGGPLLDLFGRVVAIVGGSLTPGSRFGARAVNLSPSLYTSFNGANAATPILPVFDILAGDSKTLEALTKDGSLTVPIVAIPELGYGGTSAELQKHFTDPMPKEVTDFSTRDPQICVTTLWLRRAKRSKGQVSATIYDVMNHPRVKVEPKKVTMFESPVRVSFTFAPASLPPGLYRIDVNWDDQPVWRTFVRITD